MTDRKPSPGVADRASNTRVLGECPPGWNADPHAMAIDARVAEMRAFLARMRPTSDAEALKCLRDAFPEASLSARVAVIAGAARR